MECMKNVFRKGHEIWRFSLRIKKVFDNLVMDSWDEPGDSEFVTISISATGQRWPAQIAIDRCLAVKRARNSAA